MIAIYHNVARAMGTTKKKIIESSKKQEANGGEHKMCPTIPL